MEGIIRGFKGFDNQLRCRGFQYEIGQTYEMAEYPDLCNRGYHFSATLKGAMGFYPNSPNKGNRWCVVEALGDIEGKDDKLVTNKLHIVREITADELCAELDGLNLRVLSDVAARGGAIGGSLGLKLQGFDLGRTPHDVDFVFPDDKSVNETFKTFENAALGSVITENKGIKNRRSFYDKDYKMVYDVFVKSDVVFVEKDFYGVKVKVVPYLKIWGEKVKYAFNGTTKHANDFLRFQSRLNMIIILSDKSGGENELMPF